MLMPLSHWRVAQRCVALHDDVFVMAILHHVRQRDAPTPPLNAEILAVHYRRIALPGNANLAVRTPLALQNYGSQRSPALGLLPKWQHQQNSPLGLVPLSSTPPDNAVRGTPRTRCTRAPRAKHDETTIGPCGSRTIDP